MTNIDEIFNEIIGESASDINESADILLTESIDDMIQKLKDQLDNGVIDSATYKTQKESLEKRRGNEKEYEKQKKAEAEEAEKKKDNKSKLEKIFGKKEKLTSAVESGDSKSMSYDLYELVKEYKNLDDAASSITESYIYGDMEESTYNSYIKELSEYTTESYKTFLEEMDNPDSSNSLDEGVAAMMPQVPLDGEEQDVLSKSISITTPDSVKEYLLSREITNNDSMLKEACSIISSLDQDEILNENASSVLSRKGLYQKKLLSTHFKSKIDKNLMKKEWVACEQDYRSLISSGEDEYCESVKSIFSSYMAILNETVEDIQVKDNTKKNTEKVPDDKKESESTSKEDAIKEFVDDIDLNGVDKETLEMCKDAIEEKLKMAYESNSDGRIKFYGNKLSFINKKLPTMISESAKNMEDEIKPIIEQLNSKGYKVKYASPGHNFLRRKEDRNKDAVYNGKLYTDARIMFKEDYNFPQAPKCWFWRSVEGKDYLDVKPLTYNEKDGSPDDAFAKWKGEYVLSLKKWASSLPEAANKNKVTANTKKGEEILESVVDDMYSNHQFNIKLQIEALKNN